VAHRVGLHSNVTMMFGAVEEPVHWARHLVRTRELQIESLAAGRVGFTEFVGLPFVHMASPIYLQRRARRGPTFRENLLVHAVARLAYGELIPNIQASWVKIGLAGVAQMMSAGCNDLGGTLINENISRAAGASHGQEMTPERFAAFAASIGRPIEQRTTSYGRVVAGGMPPSVVSV
jgi:FO synthase